MGLIVLFLFFANLSALLMVKFDALFNRRHLIIHQSLQGWWSIFKAFYVLQSCPFLKLHQLYGLVFSITNPL